MNKDKLFGNIPMNNIQDLEQLNQFDVTWLNDPAILNKSSYSIIPPEGNVVDDGRVEYVFNSDGFRSDEFKKNHEGKLHILFAGCSETEGVGSPLDTCWAKMFYDRIAYVNETSGYFNIGKAGWGFQKIIRATVQYVEKYGAPNYLFLLHPNIGRKVEWDKEQETYIQKQYYTHGQNTKDRENADWQLHSLSDKEEKDLFISFIYQMNLFEAYCKSNNIKLIWTTWENLNDMEQINKMNHLLPSFFTLPEDPSLMLFMQRDRPDGKFRIDDLKRRDGHSGILKCKWWGNAFANEAIRKGLNVHPNFFVD
jgi:hypothetical protein